MNLYIPQGLKAHHEPVSGYQKSDLIKMSIINIAFIIVLLIPFLFGVPFSILSFVFLVFFGGTILTFRRSENNISIYVMLKRMKKYYSSQKRFRYVKLDEYR